MATAPITKRKFTLSSAFTILFILLILIALAPYIIPAGSYEYSADGLVNLVTPTSAVVMSVLAIARVGHGTWWRFVWPLLLLLTALSLLVLSLGALV